MQNSEQDKNKDDPLKIVKTLAWGFMGGPIFASAYYLLSSPKDKTHETPKPSGM